MYLFLIGFENKINNKTPKKYIMNVQKLQEALETLKTDLDGVLLSSIIWKKTGLSITSYNQNDKAVVLMGWLTNETT